MPSARLSETVPQAWRLLLLACSLNQQNFINAICFHRGGLDLDPASSAH